MPTKKLKKIKSKFETNAPEALSVQLVGEFTKWDEEPIQLKKLKSGIWKTTVSLPEGTYQYRFLIDGEWCDDATATSRVDNGFGSQNCVRQVSPA